MSELLEDYEEDKIRKSQLNRAILKGFGIFLLVIFFGIYVILHGF